VSDEGALRDLRYFSLTNNLRLVKKISAPQKYPLSQENRKINKSDSSCVFIRKDFNSDDRKNAKLFPKKRKKFNSDDRKSQKNNQNDRKIPKTLPKKTIFYTFFQMHKQVFCL